MCDKFDFHYDERNMVYSYQGAKLRSKNRISTEILFMDISIKNPFRVGILDIPTMKKNIIMFLFSLKWKPWENKILLLTIFDNVGIVK